MKLAAVFILAIYRAGVFLAVAADANIESEPFLALKKVTTSEERIRSHGYPAESHFVETSDGYILNIFRLPFSHKLQNQNTPRPAILLQHGLFSNSDCWLSSGPNDSLAYNLVDAGYDVWLGNARGNMYSRNNSRISTKHPKFWRFSWHEIGLIDMPAMIDYILKQTGQRAVHYAGHSQGTTVYFVMLSEKPEYNAKIKSAHMLAPCAFFEHGKSRLAKMLAPLVGTPSSIWYNLLNSMELLPDNTLISRLIDTSCGQQPALGSYCKNVYEWVYGEESTNTNISALQVLIETHPGGISSDQGIHYIQLHTVDTFRQFDFGEKQNLKVYNQLTPPEYNLNNIKAATYLYSSANDALCVPQDVDILAARLKDADDYRIPDATWSHSDFITATQMKEVINDRVVRICNEYENNMK